MSYTQAKHILLIEDDDFIRDLYKRQFTLAKFDVVACKNGKDGLQMLNGKTYDLVLLDIMLPDMNGLDILKKIKGDEKIKHIPVILLTNLGQETIIKEGFILGAQNYIIKVAHTPDQIVEKVKDFFKR